MSRAYSISEFASCLKLGAWFGGEVESLGQLSFMRLLSQGSKNAGLWGVPVAFGVMLEQSTVGDTGKTDLDFSVYDPYDGAYKLYRVMCELTVAQAMAAVVDGVVSKDEKRKRSSGVVGNKSPYAFNRKYTAEYTSPRSGAVGTVGRRFGRE